MRDVGYSEPSSFARRPKHFSSFIFQAIVREDGAGRQIDLSHVEIARRHHVGTETSGEIFVLEYGPTLRVIGFALGVSEIEYVSRTVT